jgi:hypothetical protein
VVYNYDTFGAKRFHLNSQDEADDGTV